MATLTHAMLNDLHRGNAHIFLLSASDGQVAFASKDFSAADEIYTVKDTFQITQDAPSVTELKIDQNDETIDTDTESGAMTLTGTIPSVNAALMEYFYKKATTAVSGVKGSDGTTYSGIGIFKDPKEVIATVMVESASKKTAVAFARVKFVCAFGQSSTSDPLGLTFTGTVLGNLKDGVGDIAILKAASA